MKELAIALKKLWSAKKEYIKIINPDEEKEQIFLDGAIWSINILIQNSEESENKQKITNEKK